MRHSIIDSIPTIDSKILTENDHTERLVGKQEYVGPEGKQGPIGPEGKQGPTGPKGIQGDITTKKTMLVNTCVMLSKTPKDVLYIPFNSNYNIESIQVVVNNYDGKTKFVLQDITDRKVTNISSIETTEQGLHVVKMERFYINGRYKYFKNRSR